MSGLWLVPPPRLSWEAIVRRGLEEDLGLAGDLTTDAIVDPAATATAALVARAPGVVAGLAMAACAFELVDRDRHTASPFEFRSRVDDGSPVAAGTVLAELRGPARTLLTAERTALNLLGRLSGIATATRALVERIGRTPPHVVCTRKTTPGLRVLEKYAVRAGGGSNHRFSLGDAVLIKDNHIAAAGDLETAVTRVRGRVGHLVKVEVEVDTLEQLEIALELGVEVVLLDNMTLDELRRGVELCRGRAVTEASGGITLDNAREVAGTGVDLISVGWLTHSAPALDVGLDFGAG